MLASIGRTCGVISKLVVNLKVKKRFSEIKPRFIKAAINLKPVVKWQYYRSFVGILHGV